MKFLLPVLMCVSLSALAIKLLMQSRRHGGGPESWAGLFFLGMALGLPLRMSGVTMIHEGVAGAAWVNGAGHVSLFVASICLTLFTWRVFHRDSKAVRWFVYLFLAAQVGATVWSLAMGAAHSEEGNALVVTNALRAMPTIWACVESVRYWRGMRRRVELGLGDPVVSNRFALWAVWTGAFASLPTVALTLRLVLPIMLDDLGARSLDDVADTVLGPLRALMLVAGVVGIVALVLSFFPPSWYTARLRASVESA